MVQYWTKTVQWFTLVKGATLTGDWCAINGPVFIVSGNKCFFIKTVPILQDTSIPIIWVDVWRNGVHPRFPKCVICLCYLTRASIFRWLGGITLTISEQNNVWTYMNMYQLYAKWVHSVESFPNMATTRLLRPPYHMGKPEDKDRHASMAGAAAPGDLKQKGLLQLAEMEVACYVDPRIVGSRINFKFHHISSVTATKSCCMSGEVHESSLMRGWM